MSDKITAAFRRALLRKRANEMQLSDLQTPTPGEMVEPEEPEDPRMEEAEARLHEAKIAQKQAKADGSDVAVATEQQKAELAREKLMIEEQKAENQRLKLELEGQKLEQEKQQLAEQQEQEMLAQQQQMEQQAQEPDNAMQAAAMQQQYPTMPKVAGAAPFYFGIVDMGSLHPFQPRLFKMAAGGLTDAMDLSNPYTAENYETVGDMARYRNMSPVQPTVGQMYGQRQGFPPGSYSLMPKDVKREFTGAYDPAARAAAEKAAQAQTGMGMPSTMPSTQFRRAYVGPSSAPRGPAKQQVKPRSRPTVRPTRRGGLMIYNIGGVAPQHVQDYVAKHTGQGRVSTSTPGVSGIYADRQSRIASEKDANDAYQRSERDRLNKPIRALRENEAMQKRWGIKGKSADELAAEAGMSPQELAALRKKMGIRG